MTERATRPSELAITLAALPGGFGSREGWMYADEVRGRLGLLGFAPTAQQVAAWLGRMSRVDAPWVEVREHYGFKQYRVTRFGRTDIANRIPACRPYTPWLDARPVGSSTQPESDPDGGADPSFRRAA